MTSPLAAILCLTGLMLAATSALVVVPWIVFLAGIAVELSANGRLPTD